jgi:hypothetical protein
MMRMLPGIACLLALFLCACGGGGGGSGTLGVTPCVEGGERASFSYPGGLAGVVGTPTSATPAVSGVPSFCTGAKHFDLASGTLPPGMALDAQTGIVSGTPTTSGPFTFEVRMTVQNFSGSLSGNVVASINNPAAFTFRSWEVMTTNAPFLDDFQLGVLGGRLYAVSRGFYSHVVETYESTDGGANWNLLPGPGPTGDLRGFALASNANGIYLSGGSDGTSWNSGVWRFDGTAWTRLTAAGAFPARERHAMVSHAGALYILGGRAGLTFFEDTWRSDDGGTTWRLTAATGFQPRYDFCALSDGAGAMYVMGGKFFIGMVTTGGTVNNAVFRSTDGSSWSGLPVSATSPVVTTIMTHSGACAMLGNRIVYAGDGPNLSGSSTASSTDGVSWVFEPHNSLGLSGLSAGGVALGGRVYVTSGSGTSQRSVTRTVP